MNAERSPEGGGENGSDWIRTGWAEVAPGTFQAAAINKRTGQVLPSAALSMNEQPTEQTKRILKGATITFDDTSPAIIVDDIRCNLPPFKNEHFLCRALFAHRVGESIDWSTIYEEMESGGAASKSGNRTTKTTEQQAQVVKDAVHALNERVREVIGTDDQLITWARKIVRRNF